MDETRDGQNAKGPKSAISRLVKLVARKGYMQNGKRVYNIPNSLCGYADNSIEEETFDCDECTLKTDNCDVKAKCANKFGSFTCTCNTGYSGDGTNCTDDDECTDNTDNCDSDATCTNTAGSFTCTCNTGYTGDGNTCSDVDECTANTDNCDENASCTNTAGSFTCTCNDNFTGDGIACAPGNN